MKNIRDFYLKILEVEFSILYKIGCFCNVQTISKKSGQFQKTYIMSAIGVMLSSK